MDDSARPSVAGTGCALSAGTDIAIADVARAKMDQMEGAVPTMVGTTKVLNGNKSRLIVVRRDNAEQS